MSRISPLEQGCSGAELAASGDIITKINPQSPEKIHNDKQGAAILAAHPGYRDRVLTPTSYDPKRPSIEYPFVRGIDLRAALVGGHLQPDEVQRLAEQVFTSDLTRAQERLVATPARPVSMQRQEWADTLRRLKELTPTFDPRQPIVVEDAQLPSINDVIAAVDAELQKPPTHVDFGHNDLTPSNIIIGEDGEPTYIDYEWAVGPADPAESFVRTTKAMKAQDATLAVEPTRTSQGGLVLLSGPQFPYAATHYQTLMAQGVERIARTYDDPEFERRFLGYMAGSYLRELALSETRGGDYTGYVAAAQAATALKVAQEL